MKEEMENVCQLDSISHWSEENILEYGSGYSYVTYE